MDKWTLLKLREKISGWSSVSGRFFLAGGMVVGAAALAIGLFFATVQGISFLRAASVGGDRGVEPAAQAGPTQEAIAAFSEATGLRLVRVAVVAGGGMVDVRYQVVDAVKAAVLHFGAPTVIDVESGQEFQLPWMDHGHGDDFHPGVVYFKLLVNHEGIIQPGREVNVRIGESTLEGVIVQ
jgi:hypothetical protein